MKRHINEILLIALAIVAITGGYLLLVMRVGGLPAPSGVIGELMSTAGFLLMILAAVLYPIRKRLKKTAGWGSMQCWLQFHIFAGIIGPYLVLLHTSWRFSGLAGMVSLLMFVVVISGIIGRYIFTGMPRSAAGVELGHTDLAFQIADCDAQVQDWLAANSEVRKRLPEAIIKVPSVPYNPFRLMLGRVCAGLARWWQWKRTVRSLKDVPGNTVSELGDLLSRRRSLRYRVASLALARRFMALWHAVHVPVSVALFTAASAHIMAAVYYMALAR